MPLFVVFVFGAVILGAGAMLSPALPTRQPRIGVAAVVAVALIIGGALFWQSLFGGDTLVIDYVLFALVMFVVLGGTFSQGQARAEADGGDLPDADQGWTGPQDLLFFGLVGLALLVLLRYLAPPASDATLSPGLELLTGYLSQQLSQPRPFIQESVAAVVALLSLWAVYDLGGELRDKRTGRALGLVALPGILALFAGGQFMLLLSLAFCSAWLLFVLRVQRLALWQDVLAGGLMLGATLYAGVPALVAALLAGAAWWFFVRGYDAAPAELPPPRRYGAAAALPGIALAGTLPWLVAQGAAVAAYAGDLLMGATVLLALLAGTLAGGLFLLAVWQRWLPPAVRDSLYRSYYPLAFIAGGVLLVLFLLL
ncbi:MAG: hypothetical protein MUE40_20855 [Anaerolineae bacterium]|nr:hypothetical protein [Anaerolineae bacterium]